MCRGHSRASPEGGSSRGVGCRTGTGEKPRQGPVPGCLASVDPSLRQLQSTEQTLGSTISHGAGLLCPQATGTQARVALRRATGAGTEAPVCQDKPLGVTGAGPQEQTPQRLDDGYRAGKKH